MERTEKEEVEQKNKKKRNMEVRSNTGTSLASEYHKQLCEWVDIGLLHRFKMAQTGSSWIVAGFGSIIFRSRVIIA